MKARWAPFLFALTAMVWAQSDPVDPSEGDEYTAAVEDGQLATAGDDEALELQELVGTIEESGAYQDGEYEVLGTATPPPPGFADE